MSILVRTALFAAGALLIPTAAFASWQEEDAKARAMYGRADIPLVSETRTFARGPLARRGDSEDSLERPAISYGPDSKMDYGAGISSYSQLLHLSFARAVRNTGLPPISATKSEQHIELLLWCRGVSRIDYLYGSRAARLVVDRKSVAITATARDSLKSGNPVNFEAASKKTTLAAGKLDSMVQPALWAPFFDAKPMAYDMTLPTRHKECVVEAYQRDKYAFLWRADYHNDAAAEVIDGLWAFVNQALPAKPVPRYFPSPLFFPDEDLRTSAGSYWMSEAEKLAWHNQWDANFTERLINFGESPLYGTKPKAPVFRQLVAAAQNVFGDEVVTMTFGRNGGAIVKLKSYELGRCPPKANVPDFVIREFSASRSLAAQIYDLLTSDDFRQAAGDEQCRFCGDGAELLFEFLTPDGNYTARKRWSLKNKLFGKLTDLTHKVTKSPAAQAESAVAFRKRIYTCLGQPAMKQ